MSTTRWRFVNRANATETIIVHELESARVLSRLIKAAGGAGWSVYQETLSDGLLDELQAPPPPPEVSAPAPVAAVAPQPATPAPIEVPPVVEMTLTPVPTPVTLAEPAPAAAEEEIELQAEPTGILPTEFIEAPAPSPQFVAPPKPQPQVAAPVMAPPPAAPRPRALNPASRTVEKKGSERRRHRRFNQRYRVVLVAGERVFRTHSSNISLGGMLLATPVPAALMSETCMIYIGSSDSKENIELKCQLLGDPRDPARVSFFDPETAELKRLEEWIMQHAANAAA